MKNILFLLLFLSPVLCQAQQVTQSEYNAASADLVIQNTKITNANNSIASDNADITAQGMIVSTANTAIASDNAIIAAYNIAYAQTASGWNFLYDAQLEAAGCRWANCFPVVFPNANLSAIAAQINITCPVAESSVNWSNAAAYITAHGNFTATTWNSWYCAEGPAS